MTTLHGIEVKVGDKVWDSNLGWDEVIKVCLDSEFPIKTRKATYTANGMFYMSGKLPSLFWQEFEIPAHAFVKPKSMVKKYLVLYKFNSLFYTTADNLRGIYHLNEEDFCKKHPNLKFISLILESEIEEEEIALQQTYLEQIMGQIK